MTTRKATKAAASGDGLVLSGKKPTLDVTQTNGENMGHAIARVAVDPDARHAFNISQFSAGLLGRDKQPNITETVKILREQVDSVDGGNLNLASRILASQALSLDAMFTELARRGALNFGEYPDAADRYMRLALKAQSNCRATLDTLAKLHQPREQTVRHVHVNEGGQAVVADHFHNHTGAVENGKSVKQCHATGTTGASTALPCPDAGGNGVPISSCEGQAAMQNARRHESGCT